MTEGNSKLTSQPLNVSKWCSDRFSSLAVIEVGAGGTYREPQYLHERRTYLRGAASIPDQLSLVAGMRHRWTVSSQADSAVAGAQLLAKYR